MPRGASALLSAWLLVACGTEMDAPDASVACTSAAECDDGTFCNGAELCESERCAPGPLPCAACDESADACDCTQSDSDGDRHDAIGCGGDDCDDIDRNRHPGIAEICDIANVDEDCDPRTFGVRDGDDDGYPDARCCNGAMCGSDCDDASASVHPAEAESCDARDNDCDAEIDEGVRIAFYPDLDGDGFANPTGEPDMQCARPPRTSDRPTDCDDARADVHPAAVEACDGIDNNCDRVIDPECDCENGDARDCGTDVGACALGRQLCIGGGWTGCIGGVDPREEACNTLDDDCDGDTDEMLLLQCWRDADADGYGGPEAPVDLCPDPTRPSGCTAGYAERAGDCNDSNATAHPGGTETCNAVDDNCDGEVDELLRFYCARDADGDGYGGAGSPLEWVCADRTGDPCWCPFGYSCESNDCHDGDPRVHPNQPLYFAEPYCSPSLFPCETFDYDCNSMWEQEPDRPANCSAPGTACFLPWECGDSGWVTRAGASSGCGETNAMEVTTCTCTGTSTLECAGVVSYRARGCH